MTVEVTKERERDHWLVKRKGAEWRFWQESRADAKVKQLESLPDEASPLGWPLGFDLGYDREA